MMFYVTNGERFPLPTEPDKHVLLPFYRMEHRATIGHGGSKYMVVVDAVEQKVLFPEYLDSEEPVEDDLALEVIQFASEKGFLAKRPPMMKTVWERFV